MLIFRIMKNWMIALLLAGTTFTWAHGQDNTRYTDARQFQIVGKGLPTSPVYQRFDSLLDKELTPAVKHLSKHSSGIAVLFETNSTYIKAKWTLANGLFYNNIVPICHSGLDLYAWNNGKWQWAGVGRPGDKETANAGTLVSNMDGAMRQYMLYLPTYNELTSLEIGVAPEAQLGRPASPKIDTTHRIVIYGSSILQGASASRAGMVYSSILQRKTGWDVVNLGFSGNGKMEFPVAELLAKMPASVFVLDCIPNPSPKEIKERAYPFIKHLLDKRPEVPILLVETVIRENGYFDRKIDQDSKDKNAAIREAYTKLKSEGYKQLYYLPATNLIGSDHEGTIDGVHLTDLGYLRQLEAMWPQLKKLMKKSLPIR